MSFSKRKTKRKKPIEVIQENRFLPILERYRLNQYIQEEESLGEKLDDDFVSPKASNNADDGVYISAATDGHTDEVSTVDAAIEDGENSIHKSSSSTHWSPSSLYNSDPYAVDCNQNNNNSLRASLQLQNGTDSTNSNDSGVVTLKSDSAPSIIQKKLRRDLDEAATAEVVSVQRRSVTFAETATILQFDTSNELNWDGAGQSSSISAVLEEDGGGLLSGLVDVDERPPIYDKLRETCNPCGRHIKRRSWYRHRRSSAHMNALESHFPAIGSVFGRDKHQPPEQENVWEVSAEGAMDQVDVRFDEENTCCTGCGEIVESESEWVKHVLSQVHAPQYTIYTDNASSLAYIPPISDTSMETPEEEEVVMSDSDDSDDNVPLCKFLRPELNVENTSEEKAPVDAEQAQESDSGFLDIEAILANLGGSQKCQLCEDTFYTKIGLDLHWDDVHMNDVVDDNLDGLTFGLQEVFGRIQGNCENWPPADVASQPFPPQEITSFMASSSQALSAPTQTSPVQAFQSPLDRSRFKKVAVVSSRTSDDVGIGIRYNAADIARRYTCTACRRSFSGFDGCHQHMNNRHKGVHTYWLDGFPGQIQLPGSNP